MSIYSEVVHNKMTGRKRNLKINLDNASPDQCKKLAEYWYELSERNYNWVQAYQGKIAVLKHENNKLRRANERIRDELAALRELRDEVIKDEIREDSDG